jgi:hypothetical protein
LDPIESFELASYWSEEYVTSLTAIVCFVRIQNSHRAAVMGADGNEFVGPEVLLHDLPNSEANINPEQ